MLKINVYKPVYYSENIWEIINLKKIEFSNLILITPFIQFYINCQSYKFKSLHNELCCVYFEFKKKAIIKTVFIINLKPSYLYLFKRYTNFYERHLDIRRNIYLLTFFLF